jgi:hypothetical protein
VTDQLDSQSAETDTTRAGTQAAPVEGAASNLVPGTETVRDEQGPGWLPALMAGGVLLGIFGFIFCGVSTWVLFQKRTQLAIRTLKGAYVTELEQSYLEPETKQAVVAEVQKLIADMEDGKYENWQSAAIMQRLQRLPVVQWGELQAVQLFIEKTNSQEKAEQLKQLSRLERAVENGLATSFDFKDVLEPVHQPDPGNASGFSLIQPFSSKEVVEVCSLAKLVADRAEIPDQEFPDVDLVGIVRSEIDEGATAGGF